MKTETMSSCLLLLVEPLVVDDLRGYSVDGLYQLVLGLLHLLHVVVVVVGGGGESKTSQFSDAPKPHNFRIAQSR